MAYSLEEIHFMADHTFETLGLNDRHDAPRDRLIWALGDEGNVMEVSYNRDASYWLGDVVFSRQDGEAGSFEGDDMIGWSDDRLAVEGAAERFLNEAI